MSEKPLYTIPISERPPGHGPLFSKVFFPIFNLLCVIGINSAQFIALPLLLIPFGLGRRLYDDAIGWTKDGYGRMRELARQSLILCADTVDSVIAMTILFAPTSIILTTNTPPSITNLVERDSKTGQMTKLNLPDRLVIMGNHQAYTDWMYIWILACYAGHAKGVIILLKASLKQVPIIGWGMASRYSTYGWTDPFPAIFQLHFSQPIMGSRSIQSYHRPDTTRSTGSSGQRKTSGYRSRKEQL